MRRFTLSELNELRRSFGRTVALFLTDRCPVGCRHCSVASQVDSPTVDDWPLFTEVVAGICALQSVCVVAITGGEPFVERRGLTYAVQRLHAADKSVVLFTSGFWARRAVPPWIADVLRLTSVVYLSTDTFHAEAGIELARAVDAVTAAGCHLVLQVLDEPGALAAALALCPEADVSVVEPLASGRGARLFGGTPSRSPAAFGRCLLLNSPTIRYDGVIVACCNEAVIMGRGPDRLQRRITRARDVAPTLAMFRDDPVLRVMGRYGPAALEPVVDGPAGSICDPCWAAHRRVAVDRRAAAMVTLLGSRA